MSKSHFESCPYYNTGIPADLSQTLGEKNSCCGSLHDTFCAYRTRGKRTLDLKFTSGEQLAVPKYEPLQSPKRVGEFWLSREVEGSEIAKLITMGKYDQLDKASQQKIIQLHGGEIVTPCWENCPLRDRSL